MSTRFLVILTFLFFQTSGTSTITTSSNVTCIQRERESLLQFKQALTNSSNLLSTWRGLECCEWHGVGCDSRNGHVVKLDLRSPGDFWFSYNWLGGKLSHSLQNLKHLRYLDLSMNNFIGNIPEFLGSFESLEYLNLSQSGFSGIVPHHLGNLSRLQYLDFKNCFVEYDDHHIVLVYGTFLRAPIIDDLGWVSSLSSLTYLDLSGITIGNHTDWLHPVNMLPSLLTLNLAWSRISYIPNIKFANFTSLSSLDLSLNDINSSIPSWLSNLTALMHLNLQENRFHVKVPEFVGSFNALTSIDLSRNSFEISIPNMLCNLSSLVRLDLSWNMFSGHIPASLGLILSLEALYLNHNQLSGNLPMSLGQLSKLKSLDLSGNSLVGALSETHFTKLKNLLHLELSENSLALNFSTQWIPPFQLQTLRARSCNIGPNFPNWLQTQKNLQWLDHSNSGVRDTVPEGLSQLSKLKNLDLSYNSLFGVLSETHFTKLKNLIQLDLSWSSFSLNFSSQWIPPFQLQILEARSCNIGPHFPNWLQTQTNLQRLDISNSSVSDKIPEWFENILNHIDYLDLSNNKIGGKLPRFDFNRSNQMVCSTFKMNSNKYEGSLARFPSNVYFLDLSENLLSGHVPQPDETMNPVLEVVNLSNNRFTGIIPVHLCKLASIWVLDLSQNKFSGRLPGCLGNLISLRALDISNNIIYGVVPSSLGSLSNLKSLHLHNNRLEGNLPLSFKNLAGLITMDIGNNYFVGSIPFWIGENLSSLRILNLELNKFTGKIPLQLCQLNALQLLNLAQNNISGTIPRCFSNLSGMMITNPVELVGFYTYVENILASMKGIQLVYTTTIRFLTSLDLSSNNITGEIPDALMNLVGLKNLNLSRNQLKGQIPMTIGNLSQMESLDLSMNMLYGRIPQSLTSLNFLSYLNLSNNNLSGAIPIGNQIQTLADPYIYEGNEGLCGPQVSRSCKGNSSTYYHVGEHDGQDDDEGLWHYGGMGSGFFAGFVGLVCSLFFIKSWRLSYFKILGSVYGWLTVLLLLNLALLKRKCFS